MQLVVQFVYFFASVDESLSSGRGNAIDAARPGGGPRGNGPEQAAALHAMQQRIERSRPDAVAMVREFFHHGQPEDGLKARVQKHVNADEPVKQFAPLILHRKHYSAVPGKLS